MSDLEKLRFPSLELGGTNYIVWALEASNYLCADGIGHTINSDFQLPSGHTQSDLNKRKDAAKAVCLILRHLQKDLKFNYLEERNPAVIWNSLKLRFDTDRKQAMLPLLNDEWNKLCFYNFKTVNEYATKLYSITSELSWCGRKVDEAEKIEKTLTTFSPAERILSAQYRRMGHDTFDKLIATLLLDEKHGILLQRNHDERRLPTPPKPEVNFGDGRQNFKSKRLRNGKKNWKHKQGRSKKSQLRGRNARSQSQTKRDTACHKCGDPSHWANRCNASEFHCKLYKQSKAWTSRNESKKDKGHPKSRNISFMTNLSDDSDFETEVVEVFSNEPSDAYHCLVDSATTHVILKDKRFFTNLDASRAPKTIKTLGGSTTIAKGVGPAQVILPGGSTINITYAIYAPKASRNLLSFADLRKNGFHINTASSSGVECLQLVDEQGNVVEEFKASGSGLYATTIQPQSSHSSYSSEEGKRVHPDSVQHGTQVNQSILWHDRLGHPGRAMLQRLTNAVQGIPLHPRDIMKNQERLCHPCAIGKLQNRTKTNFSSNKFKPKGILDTLVSDVCGPISPPSGPFNYYMIVKDSSARYSNVQLLTSRNEVMPKLLTSIIHLKTRFPNHPIKNVRVDNAAEYVSKSFQEFCSSSGIVLETSVPHAHNTSAENFVKQIQMIARPLLLRSQLPLSCWGHAVLHAGDLIRYRPSAENQLSPYELVNGFAPQVSHLRTFGCAVYVPIPPHLRTKMGPRRQLGIYVGFQSPSIIRYLSPETGDLFTAHITMCMFDETLFPKLGKGDDASRDSFDFEQPETKDLHKDPYTAQGEKEVRRILHLNKIIENAPDAFVATERMTRSNLNDATNYPSKVAIENDPATSFPPLNKRGRPKGAKDQVPRKRRTNNERTTMLEVNERHPTTEVPSETASAYVALHQEDIEPTTVDECRSSPDWPKWKAAIKAELQSLFEREVFGDVQECPPNLKPIGCRWVFTRKRDKTGKVIRFKARLVAKGFTQRYGIDYSDTYSPVMTMTTFRWLLAFAARNNMKIRQADIETAYLYGTIDVELYMKVPEGIRVKGELRLKLPCVRVFKSLYGLKQAGRIWYLHFSKYLIKCGFQTDECCPCLFVKRSGAEICIIGIYVDDIVMVGSDAAVESAMLELKTEFKVKDLGMLSYCLGLEVSQSSSGVLLLQANYITKILERFNLKDVSKAAKTPMVVRSLNPASDIFGPRRDSEVILDPYKYPYKEAIGALLYLANCSRPDISFAVSVLSRSSSQPTKRHWSGIKKVMRYLAKTINYGLLYQRRKNNPVNVLITDDIVGYADAGYLSDPHKGRSQTGYVFISASGAISWRSTKQTLAATSTNQSELIALYEACRECLWIRRFIEFVRHGLKIYEPMKPIKVYEDNSACIAQVQRGYIKTDRSKHIDPKFFFMHDLNNKELVVTMISSESNLADLFTKALGSTKHWGLTHGLGMFSP